MFYYYTIFATLTHGYTYFCHSKITYKTGEKHIHYLIKIIIKNVFLFFLPKIIS